jgi:hypothetical protein
MKNINKTTAVIAISTLAIGLLLGWIISEHPMKSKRMNISTLRWQILKQFGHAQCILKSVKTNQVIAHFVEWT